MATTEHVHHLLVELGPLLELGAVVEYDGQNAWSLGVDEETAVHAEFHADEDRLYLSANVASPPEARRAATYDLLLQYNNQWTETGGIRMALDGPAGRVVQITDLRVTGLDVSSLESALVSFLEKLRAWRDMVGQGITDDSDPQPGSENPSRDLAPGFGDGNIRV